MFPQFLTAQRTQTAVDIVSLKARFVSSDWAIAEPALDELVGLGGEEVIGLFHLLLGGHSCAVA